MSAQKIPPGMASDPKDIFVCAVAFNHAAEVLLAAIEVRRASPPVPTSIPGIIPVIVNITFSIELYFKCIVALETGNHPWGHDLAKLFNDISASRQARIETLYAEAFNECPELVEDRNQAANKADFDLRPVLQQASRAFEEWRYRFENPAITSYPTFPVRYAAHKAVLELKPEWIDVVNDLGLPPKMSPH